MTLARMSFNHRPRQRRLLLPVLPAPRGGQPGDRSRPVEQTAATCHTVTTPSTPSTPKRPVTAAVAAPNAASTSRHGQPRALGTAWSTPARCATYSNRVRTVSNRAPITRSQPRAVAAGTPSVGPITRCPDPPARATRAAPITSTAYARRSSTVTGNRTWVTRHAEQRARRGCNTPARPWTPSGRAHPHGRSPPEQSGQTTCQDINRNSTRT